MVFVLINTLFQKPLPKNILQTVLESTKGDTRTALISNQ